MRRTELTEPWASLVAAFGRYEIAVRGFTPATVAHHASYLAAFATWWERAPDRGDPRHADQVQLAEFLVHEEGRGMAPATRVAQLGALRGFFDWLIACGVITANPARHLPTPRVPPPNVDIYQPHEVTAILGGAARLTDLRGRQRHAIVALLRYTGIRNSEAGTLRRAELDLDAARARVVGKGARTRVVPLPAPLVEVLADFLAEVRPQLPDSPLLFANAHPFVTTPQHGFGQEALAREVELAGEAAGVSGRHYPHRWRHTFATELVRAGVDIHIVQRLLGHASIASTVGYTHLAVEDLVPAVTAVFERCDSSSASGPMSSG